MSSITCVPCRAATGCLPSRYAPATWHTPARMTLYGTGTRSRYFLLWPEGERGLPDPRPHRAPAVAGERVRAGPRRGGDVPGTGAEPPRRPGGAAPRVLRLCSDGRSG